MSLAQLKYKTFQWPEAPESFRIRCVRSPEYVIDENGKYNYTGISPVCRVISGEGVFRGTYAYDHFNALQVIMANGTAGELIHSQWGTISAFLTMLEMGQDSREGFVTYAFTFREADESGVIPALPEEKIN